MNNDLLNILTNDNDDLDNQKLIDYLNGKLSDNEKHEVEKWMADNNIANDAVEGLQNIKDKKSLSQYVEQLNNNLQIQLEKKKEYRFKRKLKEYPWIYFAVVLILLLCIVGFVILRMILTSHH
ncbi:MAG TPA: hypothetical protein VKT28_09640 [Puia sp.]|nr:hypothetical protein [Puia sp.]